MSSKGPPTADPLIADHPALACIELATLARGVVVLDQMAKRAKTTIVAARSLSPGRYLVLLSGKVAEIEEAMDAARSTAEDDHVDDVVIRDPHARLEDALASRLETELSEALAIVETSTVSACLWAADRALKEADIDLMELRLGAGLSGKGVFTLTGRLHMVEAARDAVRAATEERRLIRIELISNPHPDLPKHLLGAEPALPRR